MSLEQQVANLVEASNNLTNTVNTKIVEIDKEVDDARKSMDNFIDDSKSFFVNQKGIPNPGYAVRVWKIGLVDFYGEGDFDSGEVGYIDLLMLNGRDYGDQAPRKVGFTAAFRSSFSAEHYFIGQFTESYNSGSHFVLAREPGQEKGRYTLYMVQADYNYVTIVVMHETTPLSSGLEEMEMIHQWGATGLNQLNWQTDVLEWIQQNENVEVVYDTYKAPTATMSVGKIRYVEMEQITLPAE